jgi:hypothetical protein
VALERAGDVPQLRANRRQPLVQHRKRFRRVRPGHDVLALGVEQHVAVQHRLAGRRVPGERDAGRGIGSEVPEDHRLDSDGRPEVVGIDSRRR